MALFAAVLTWLGIRLVRSGLRARGAELWLGLFFVGIGATIPPRYALASGVAVAVDPAVLDVACQALMHAAVCCLAAFVWRTFRPASAVARRVFQASVPFFGAILVLFVTTGAHVQQGNPFHVVTTSSIGAVIGWAFVESARYYAMLRRRVALGIGDPVVGNRFLLWVLWTGGFFGLGLVVNSVRVINLASNGWVAQSTGMAVSAEAGWAMVVIRTTVALVSPVIAAALWLGFFPPQRYLGWIRTRAAGPASA